MLKINFSGKKDVLCRIIYIFCSRNILSLLWKLGGKISLMNASIECVHTLHISQDNRNAIRQLNF